MTQGYECWLSMHLVSSKILIYRNGDSNCWFSSSTRLIVLSESMYSTETIAINTHSTTLYGRSVS